MLRWRSAGTLLLSCLVALGPLTPVARAATGAQGVGSPSLAVEKQRLQIEQLRRDLSLEGRLGSFATAASVLIAVLAAAGGGYTYLQEGRRTRRLRIEERTNAAQQEILAYPGATSRNARLLAALSSMRALSRAASDADVKEDASSLLAQLAMDGAVDLGDVDQARFDGLCHAEWPDWERYWRENPDRNEAFLQRSREALQTMRSGNQAAFAQLALDGDAIEIPPALAAQDEHLRLLLESSRWHIGVLPPARGAAAREALGTALGNPGFVSAWLSA